MVLESIAHFGPQIAGQVATAQIFQNLLGNLSRLDFFEFLLPFLLFLAIFFGALKFAVGDRMDRNVTGLISIVAAFFVLNYSGNFGVQIASFFTTFFGGTMIILAGMLVIIVFLGLVGFKTETLFVGNHKWGLVMLLIFIGILLFVGAGGGGLLSIPSSIGGFTLNDISILVFFLIVIGLAVWFLGSQGESKGSGGGGKPSTV